MSGELTTAKTHLTALQNEVTSLRQREAELSSQLSKVTSEADKYRNELTRVKDSHTGLTAYSLILPLCSRLTLNLCNVLCLQFQQVPLYLSIESFLSWKIRPLSSSIV